jgi:hypothetical protein
MGEQELKNGLNLISGDWIDFKLEKVQIWIYSLIIFYLGGLLDFWRNLIYSECWSQ